MRSKRPSTLAVVLELEAGGAREALSGRALLRDLELLVAERHAGDIALGDLGEVEPEPAPAGADIEHPLARRDGELGGEVALLGELRLFQARALREVGTGILPVAIQEEVVDGAVDVVVMRHVAPRPSPTG
jgi:hypothetical protein